jgi:putative flippase GtrA
MMRFLRRTGRYAQVGLICAIINNLVVISMDHLGYDYAISVTLGFVIVTIVGYLLHCAYTFRAKAAVAGWMRFVSANLSGFPLSMGSMFLLCDVTHLKASVAMPIATMILFGWNYLVADLVIIRSVRIQDDLIS